jgi:hypothetical protein
MAVCEGVPTARIHTFMDLQHRRTRRYIRPRFAVRPPQNGGSALFLAGESIFKILRRLNWKRLDLEMIEFALVKMRKDPRSRGIVAVADVM